MVFTGYSPLQGAQDDSILNTTFPKGIVKDSIENNPIFHVWAVSSWNGYFSEKSAIR